MNDKHIHNRRNGAKKPSPSNASHSSALDRLMFGEEDDNGDDDSSSSFNYDSSSNERLDKTHYLKPSNKNRQVAKKTDDRKKSPQSTSPQKRQHTSTHTIGSPSLMDLFGNDDEPTSTLSYSNPSSKKKRKSTSSQHANRGSGSKLSAYGVSSVLEILDTTERLLKKSNGSSSDDLIARRRRTLHFEQQQHDDDDNKDKSNGGKGRKKSPSSVKKPFNGNHTTYHSPPIRRKESPSTMSANSNNLKARHHTKTDTTPVHSPPIRRKTDPQSRSLYQSREQLSTSPAAKRRKHVVSSTFAAAATATDDDVVLDSLGSMSQESRRTTKDTAYEDVQSAALYHVSVLEQNTSAQQQPDRKTKSASRTKSSLEQDSYEEDSDKEHSSSSHNKHDSDSESDSDSDDSDNDSDSDDSDADWTRDVTTSWTVDDHLFANTNSYSEQFFDNNTGTRPMHHSVAHFTMATLQELVGDVSRHNELNSSTTDQIRWHRHSKAAMSWIQRRLRRDKLPNVYIDIGDACDTQLLQHTRKHKKTVVETTQLYTEMLALHKELQQQEEKAEESTMRLRQQLEEDGVQARKRKNCPHALLLPYVERDRKTQADNSAVKPERVVSTTQSAPPGTLKVLLNRWMSHDKTVATSATSPHRM